MSHAHGTVQAFLAGLVMLVPVAYHGPIAHADDTAYLVNVTVRQGYPFTNAADALAYGHHICDEIAAGRPYGALVTDANTDLNMADPYQGAYLVAQAANELCPALIWSLRNSAAGYQLTEPGR